MGVQHRGSTPRKGRTRGYVPRPRDQFSTGCPARSRTSTPRRPRSGWPRSTAPSTTGAGAGPLPDAGAAAARPGAGRRGAEPVLDRLHQHHPARSGSPASPVTRRPSAPTAAGSAGTPPSWCTGRSAPGIGVGGHISTYASSATLYEVGFNHFFRGKDHPGGGDQIFFQGHASPGIYARAFLEGRLTEATSTASGRRSRSPAGGLPSYPHPRLMPDFWEFPTVSMGLGPDQRDLPGPVQQVPARPRHQGHLPAARLGLPGRRRDGRAREPRRPAAGRLRGSRQPHLRGQLQPAAPRRPGPRQRQDHPGAGGLLPRRRLERHQGDLGPRVGRRCSPPTATRRWST